MCTCEPVILVVEVTCTVYMKYCCTKLWLMATNFKLVYNFHVTTELVHLLADTVSKYWRNTHITQKYNKHTYKHKNTANLLVYTNMGWLGDGSHRGQDRQAWTAVGLPLRYPKQHHWKDTSVNCVSHVCSHFKCLQCPLIAFCISSMVCSTVSNLVNIFDAY